jgi:hypothetical protein
MRFTNGLIELAMERCVLTQRINKLIAVPATGLMLTLMAGRVACAESTNNPVAMANPDATWNELQQATQLPQPPAEWKTQVPTDQQEIKYYQQVAGAATRAADAARAFYLRFPDSTNAIVAGKLECNMLDKAVSYSGDTNAVSAWGAAQEHLLAAPGLTSDDRFDVQVAMVRQKEMATRNATPGTCTDFS